MKRRTLLKAAGLTATGMTAFTGIGTSVLAGQQPAIRTDPKPLDNELDKYPRCVICNMDRRKFHYSRHLLHYGDQHAEGTCSINCTSEAMLRERKRGFTAVYAADYAAASEPKPLVEASSATYLIGSSLKGVMTPISKHSFADRASAEAEQARSGGQLADFNQAVSASLEDYAQMLTRRYASDRSR